MGGLSLGGDIHSSLYSLSLSLSSNIPGFFRSVHRDTQSAIFHSMSLEDVHSDAEKQNGGSPGDQSVQDASRQLHGFSVTSICSVLPITANSLYGSGS